MTQGRLLLGIGLFWLALSLVFNAINTLVLPRHLLGLVDGASKAIVFGLVSFVSLLAGMLFQPMAGTFSDRLRPRWGRLGTLALGYSRCCPRWPCLACHQPARAAELPAGPVAASVAQAASRGFLPGPVPPASRGTAEGFKLCMDIGGALLGLLVLGQPPGE